MGRARRRQDPSVPVLCRSCGKRLRGQQHERPGRFWVRRHNRPDGTPCIGHRLVDHTAAPDPQE